MKYSSGLPQMDVCLDAFCKKQKLGRLEKEDTGMMMDL